MAYRAEIEIGVKGTEKLRDLKSTIEALSQRINKLDELANTFQAPIQSVKNYTQAVKDATIALDKAELASIDEANAIKVVARAITEENTVRQRRLFLLDTEIRKQQGLLHAAPKTGTVELGPGGPGFSGGFTASQRQVLNEQAILRTNEAQNKIRRETLQILSREELFEIKLQKILERNAELEETRKKAIAARKGALSNAAVGAAFPLLFGQSGAAAAGGGIGGALGSLIPGVGGFGGSLIGTLIGEKAGQANKVKELAANIGFSTEQTKLLGVAFQQAGRDFDKFQASISTIQGLSLSINDQAKAVQLASTLTENYGGKIDKVTNAFANALSTGKVSQGTLNQLTHEGIPIQQALADKYGISRSAILQLAKDGKISVQDLVDTLVQLGNEGVSSAGKQQKAFNDAYSNIQTSLDNLGATVSSVFGDAGQRIINVFNTALLNTLQYIKEVIDGFDALAQVAGPALKVIVDKYLDIEFASLKAIGSIPGLANAILSVTSTVIGPLSDVISLLNIIRGARVLKKERQGPYVPERLKKPPLTSFTVPSQFVGGGGGGGSSAAENAAKRLAEQTQKQLIASGALLTDEQNRLKVTAATSDLQKLDAEYEKIRADRFQKFVKLYKDSLSNKERSNLLAAQSAAIAADDANYQDKKAKILADQTAEYYTQIGLSDVLSKKVQGSIAGAFLPGRQLSGFRTDISLSPGLATSPLQEQAQQVTDSLQKLQDPVNQISTAAESIGTSFSNSFKSVITGATSAREALAGFFQSVANAFLDMAAQIIAKWIQMTILNTVLKIFPVAPSANYSSVFSTGKLNLGSSMFGAGAPNLGLRAAGGPVTGGSPYIVGEKGPELFVPGRSGTIVPNGAMMGGSTNVVVNVDATGSNVQGNEQDGKQLGRVIALAIQSELIKQKRPGGLLA